MSQPTDQGAKLRRIQMLLAKASDPATTPEESETYMEKATELMAKYGVEQAMLDAAKPKGEREAVTQKRVVIPGPYSLDKRVMLDKIATPLNVHTIRLQGVKPSPGATVVIMVGYPSDLEQVESLFASLTLQVIRDAMRAEVPYWDNTAAFRRTFISGFAEVVGRRLAQMYQKVQHEEEQSGAPGTALVLADRHDAVEEAYKAAFPKVRNIRRSLSGSGSHAGREAGRRADLGGNKVGGGRRALT